MNGRGGGRKGTRTRSANDICRLVRREPEEKISGGKSCSGTHAGSDVVENWVLPNKVLPGLYSNCGGNKKTT